MRIVSAAHDADAWMKKLAAKNHHAKIIRLILFVFLPLPTQCHFSLYEFNLQREQLRGIFVQYFFLRLVR